ncbi:MAG: AAA family ATPase [Pseudonocardiaceae bacterium]
MPLTTPPCSDTGPYPVLVLEGMPGAGKTTTATTLATENRTVIGEYTTTTGDVVPIRAYPAVDDDPGYQHNWLRKHRQVQAARRVGPVVCDRDWLSALAYGHSVADTDDGELFASRARWAADCLDRGHLAVASTYVVLQLDPTVSLRRRANRLTPGHPWSSLPGLIRVAEFYTDPAKAVAPVHPDLAVWLRCANWHPLGDYSIDRTVQYVRDLTNRP